MHQLVQLHAPEQAAESDLAGPQRRPAADGPLRGRADLRHGAITMATAAKPGGAAAPKPTTNKAGLTRPTIAACRRRCAPAAATTRSPARSSPSAFELSLKPNQIIKLSGIGCSQQVAGLLPEPLARLQRRARPHAVGRHRRDAGQPHLLAIGVSGDGDTGSIGLGPVQAPGAPQCAAWSTSSRTTACTA